MKKLLFLAVVVAAMFTAACSKYKYETVQGDPLKTRIYTLPNGLKVYMSVNPETPRIQTYIAVKVGGKNDPAETTGLAHYFEHLMFKGTEQFGTSDYAAEKPLLDEIEQLFETYRKTTDEAERAAIYRRIDSVSYEASKIAIPNEYDKLMSTIGANGTNAYTSQDMTVYVEDIPSNQVDNWARIQADRFRNPVIRGFHTELETVYEEKNMSLTRDSRKVWEALDAALFPASPLRYADRAGYAGTSEESVDYQRQELPQDLLRTEQYGYLCGGRFRSRRDDLPDRQVFRHAGAQSRTAAVHRTGRGTHHRPQDGGGLRSGGRYDMDGMAHRRRRGQRRCRDRPAWSARS